MAAKKPLIDSNLSNLEPKTLNPQKHFWNPLIAIIIAAAVFVTAQLLAGVPLVVYTHLRQFTGDQATAWVNGTYPQFWYVLLAEVITFGAIWWFTKRAGQQLRDLGWKRFSIWAIVYALCGFAVYFVAYVLLLVIAGALVPGINLQAQQDIGFQQVAGNAQLVVTFVSLVVLPPIVEETLFRGFLFTNFRKYMGLGVSIVLTSVLFAIPHLLESQTPGSLLWVGGIDTFTLSVVLCYLREKTGSLWAGVILHAIKNGIAFAALYIFAH